MSAAISITIFLSVIFGLGSPYVTDDFIDHEVVKTWPKPAVLPQNGTRFKSGFFPNTQETEISIAPKNRVKRAAGTSMGDVKFDLIHTSVTSTTAADLGNVFTFDVEVDLPHIETATDVKMEIFALDPVTGVGGFAFCEPSIKSAGTGIESSTENLTDPPRTLEKMIDHTSVVEKINFEWKEVKTSSETEGDENKLKAEFNAMMIPLPEVTDGGIFYMSAGIEYANEAYVWIGQTQITTKLEGEKFPASVKIPNDPPDKLKIREATVITIKAAITDPFFDIKLTVSQPLGYEDIFHIGPITFETGSSYDCVEQSGWGGESTWSLSQASAVKYTLSYTGLLNTEGGRDESKAENEIIFKVPIQVVNTEKMVDGSQRDLSFGLEIGDSKLWSALHTFTIEGEETPQDGDPSNVTATLLSDHTIYQGDGVVYFLTVKVPKGWVNLDVVFEGDGDKFFASNVRVVSQGTVAYIPSTWMVTSKEEGGKVKVLFGNVNNPVDEETVVILEIAYNTDPAIAEGGHTPPDVKVGSIDVTMEEFTVVKNPETAAITVEKDDYGIGGLLGNTLYMHGQIGLDMVVNVPSGAGESDISIEAFPDFEISAFSLRVCTIDIYKIGKSLPCIDSVSEVTALEVNKSLPALDFHDMATFPIGPTCPIDRGSFVPENTKDFPIQPDDNQFRARVIYELAKSDAISADTIVKVSGGVKLGSNVLWLSSEDHTVKTDHYTNTVLGIGSNNVPFFADYPYVTYKDRRPGSITKDEVFYIKYILKPQPLSTGQYVVTFTPGNNFRVCKLVLTHIGKNFPCTQLPGHTPTGNENTVWGFAGTDFAEDTQVVLAFASLTNWGRDPLTTDLIADDNSIQIVVFYQYMGHDAENKNIGWKVDYGPESVEGATEMNVNNAAGTDYALTDDKTIELIEWTSLIGDNETIHKKLPKLLQFKFSVPAGYHNSFVFSIENNDFDDDSKQMDLCNIAVVQAGNNMPCVHAWEDSTTLSLSNDTSDETHMRILSDESDLTKHDQTVYKKKSLNIATVCSVPYSNAFEDSVLVIQAAVRVKDFTPTDETITLKVSTLDNSDSPYEEKITFKVADFDSDLVDLTKINATDLKVSTPEYNAYGLAAGIGEKIWVPFYVQVPPDSITDMELTFMMPSENQRPIMHATDVKFVECKGRNVLCVEPYIDLQRNFDVTFGQSDNISTFMSMDTVTIKPGYIFNAGFTKIWGNNKDDDNLLGLQVEIQMADHPLSDDSAIFDVYFSAKVDDIIAVTSQKINVTRDATKHLERITNEHGNIVIDVNQTESSDTLYRAGEVINFVSIIKHGNNSMAEGLPARIRVITPSYTKYVENKNNFVSNYTVKAVSADKVVLDDGGTVSVTDFEFTGGILFPDIISFNFSLTVDPNSERAIGSGEATTAIAMHPICIQSVFYDWPADESTYVGCGTMTAETFISNSGECGMTDDENIIIIQDCQVQASSQYDDDHDPYFAINDDDTIKKAWSPALRTGTGWSEYLLFDFIGVYRINRLKVQTPQEGSFLINYREVESVTIEISNSLPFFNYITEKTPDVNSLIVLDAAVETRYIKLGIKAKMDNPDASPIGIYKVKWYGCEVDPAPAGATCDTIETPKSDDRKKYRHFAVDTTTEPIEKRIIYFCDLNPYREGMFCYCSDRKSEDPNTWSELPRYIGYIEGFSPGQGRMYFSDNRGLAKLSSYNCKEVELTDSFPDDIIYAVNVPGKSRTEVNENEILWSEDDKIKADFDGLYDNDKMLVKWRSCCESGN